MAVDRRDPERQIADGAPVKDAAAHHSQTEFAALLRLYDKRCLRLRWIEGGIAITADGALTSDSGTAVTPKQAEAAWQWLHEGATTAAHERSLTARRAGAARARRRERTVYDIVTEHLRTGAFQSAHSCKCCGKELTDPASIARGIGSECWQRVLDQIERAKMKGQATDAWKETVAAIVAELPQHPSAGQECSICCSLGSNRLGGRPFCRSCADQVDLETMRRLRPARSESGTFRRFVAHAQADITEAARRAVQRAEEDWGRLDTSDPEVIDAAAWALEAARRALQDAQRRVEPAVAGDGT
jgi:hypothetical protein